MANQVMSVSFSNVVEALGGTISEPLESSSNWEFYQIKYPTPAGPMVANYLYLFHRCPLNEATPRNIARWKSLSSGKGYTIVLPSRAELAKDLKRTARQFDGVVATTARELLLDNVLNRFSCKESEDLEDKYFIEPSLRLPDGQIVPAVKTVTNWLTRPQAHDLAGNVIILVADAGLGKTTLSRALAARLLEDPDSKAVPIRIESEQWRYLIQPTLTLQSVLGSAVLRTFPDAGVMTSPNIFQVLVREGLLVPIFDGFDELCLHPNSPYSAASLLNELIELMGDTGARVIITVRETFWEKHKEGIPKDQIIETRLEGFSNDQRQEFFKKRLSNPIDRDTANRIARDIGGSIYPDVSREPVQASRANGVPLILELIAIYVDGNPNATFVPDSQDSLGPLLESMCAREIVRQQLPVSADVQMQIFEELFRDYPEEISEDVLHMYVEIYAADISPDALARFESHALLSQGKPLKPRFELLKVYFVTRWLAYSLSQSSINDIDRSKVASFLAESSTGHTDVLDWLADRFVQFDPQIRKASINHAIEIIKKSTRFEAASSAIFHLTVRISQKLEVERSGRTRFVLDHLSGWSANKSEVRGMAIQGQVEGLDLSGVEFSNCVFRDLEFRNCRFDESTKFSDCRFERGLEFENCERVSLAKLETPSLSAYAERAWDRIYGKDSRVETKESVVIDALRESLRKFLGTYGFSTIKYDDRNGGALGRNPLRDALWDELLRVGILERHEISNLSSGGLHVRKDDAIRHEVRSFLDNAVLGQKLTDIRSRLLRRF